MDPFSIALIICLFLSMSAALRGPVNQQLKMDRELGGTAFKGFLMRINGNDSQQLETKTIEADPDTVRTINDVRKYVYTISSTGQFIPPIIDGRIQESVERLYRQKAYCYGVDHVRPNNETTNAKGFSSNLGFVKNLFQDKQEKTSGTHAPSNVVEVHPDFNNASSRELAIKKDFLREHSAEIAKHEYIHQAPDFASKLVRKLDRTSTGNSDDNAAETKAVAPVKASNPSDENTEEFVPQYTPDETWNKLSASMIDTAGLLSSLFKDVNSSELVDKLISEARDFYGDEIVDREVKPEHYEKLLSDYFSGINDYIVSTADKLIKLEQAKERALSNAVSKQSQFKANAEQDLSDPAVFEDLMNDDYKEKDA